MNNYISAEEFLKQSEKVQKALLEWFNCNIHELDLVYEKGIIYLYKDFIKRENIELDSIPLFQLHQLIQFIEENGFKVCNIIRGKYSDNWCVRTSSKEEFNIRNSDSKLSLLQALWQVTCKVAEEV